jgi:DNA-binding XRE family transcriptional regulator
MVPNNDMRILADKIKVHRALNDIGKIKFATKLGIAAETLRKLETGTLRPSYSLMTKLVEVLELEDISQLFKASVLNISASM